MAVVDSNPVVVSKTINEIEDLFRPAYEQCEAACAIIDAVNVLSALERAPVHQDTHPSHNIRTGGGYASGRTIAPETMPLMLAHARSLIEMAMNDFDVLRERAIDTLKEKGVSHV